MEDGELRELATAMALTMPLETPEEAAFARRVEQHQAGWERLWRGVFALMPLVRCPDCVDGERIINPDWPAGTEPYSEKCSTCGGSGKVLDGDA